MNSEPRYIHVDLLEVIGYADAFDATSVPRRVAPIFRFRANVNLTVFPPYRLIDEFVLDAAVAPASEFLQMVDQGRVTPLACPMPAWASGMMWVDEQLEVHYGSQAEENERLQNSGKIRLMMAESSFRQGDVESALRHARWASAAVEGSLFALAIEAAALERLKRSSAAQVVKDQARDLPDFMCFDDEVNRLCNERAGTYDEVASGPLQPDKSLWTKNKQLEHQLKEERGKYKLLQRDYTRLTLRWQQYKDQSLAFFRDLDKPATLREPEQPVTVDH